MAVIVRTGVSGRARAWLLSGTDPAAVRERTPYPLVFAVCSLAAWVAGSVPGWEAVNYWYRVEDPRVFLLPMFALSALAILTRLIRHYGGAAGAGRGWRVLTAGCALYLCGQSMSWPLAFAVRYTIYHPRPYPWLLAYGLSLLLLAAGAGLMLLAPRQTWRQFIRMLYALLALLAVAVPVLTPLFLHVRAR